MIKDKRFLKSFKVLDLVLIAMLAALATAFKSIVGTLVRLITGPLGIPGGSLAGGFYMMWLALGYSVVNKRGSATLISVIQALILFTTGSPGSHGVWTFVTYIIPGICVDIVFLFSKNKKYNILHYMLSVIIANIAGTIGSNVLFFRLSWFYLLFTLVAAAFSGAVGGVIAYTVSKGLSKINGVD